jgi:hypothetical protein
VVTYIERLPKTDYPTHMRYISHLPSKERNRIDQSNYRQVSYTNGRRRRVRIGRYEVRMKVKIF